MSRHIFRGLAAALFGPGAALVSLKKITIEA